MYALPINPDAPITADEVMRVAQLCASPEKARHMLNHRIGKGRILPLAVRGMVSQWAVRHRDGQLPDTVLTRSAEDLCRRLEQKTAELRAQAAARGKVNGARQSDAAYAAKMRHIDSKALPPEITDSWS